MVFLGAFFFDFLANTSAGAIAKAAVAAVPEESNAVAKALFDFKNGGMPLAVKGAYVDGMLFDAAQIEAFSKLPSRAQLIATLMGMMKSPVQKLAGTLQAIVDQSEGK